MLMDELVDLLDENGNYTGETTLKSKAHLLGLFHPTVHIWCYTKVGELLFQKRADTKETFPGLWDITVAGHIAAAEQIEMAALREVKEEIGLTLKQEELIKVKVFKTINHHPNGIIDAEFNHVFLAPLQVPLAELVLQEEEVAALQLIPLPQLKQQIAAAAMVGFVPMSEAYWDALFATLEKRLLKAD